MEHNWQQILTDYGPAVWRTVRCLLGNEADARDCYQTVFLEGFQFSQEKQVQDWEKLLKRIARVRALDLLRKQYRRAANFDPDGWESHKPREISVLTSRVILKYVMNMQNLKHIAFVNSGIQASINKA